MTQQQADTGGAAAPPPHLVRKPKALRNRQVRMHEEGVAAGVGCRGLRGRRACSGVGRKCVWGSVGRRGGEGQACTALCSAALSVVQWQDGQSDPADDER
eukprot:203207-Chlamydomonas_euryale.AAC.3